MKFWRVKVQRSSNSQKLSSKNVKHFYQKYASLVTRHEKARVSTYLLHSYAVADGREKSANDCASRGAKLISFK